MKINWGTGLAITLGIFAFGMGFTVYQATQSEHDLVTRDYYQQELAYQSTIDGKKNAATLKEACQLRVEDQKLLLEFPASLEGEKGDLEMIMYYPTAADQDFNIEEKNWTIGRLEIPGDKLSGGKWIAKVKLNVGDKSYYFEPEILI